MTDQTPPELAAAIARLADLSQRLRQADGPHYAVLAQMAGIAQNLTENGTADYPVAGAVATSLSLVLTYPLHDHPQFNELIDVHASALRRATRDDMRGDSGARGRELIDSIDAAVARIVPQKPPAPDI